MMFLCSRRCISFQSFSFFFFNDTATTEIYTLSLHDALPIPSDARVWAADSLTIYPGLIDAFVQSSGGDAPRAGGGGPGSRRQRSEDTAPPRGAAHELPTVHPELRAVAM